MLAQRMIHDRRHHASGGWSVQPICSRVAELGIIKAHTQDQLQTALQDRLQPLAAPSLALIGQDVAQRSDCAIEEPTDVDAMTQGAVSIYKAMNDRSTWLNLPADQCIDLDLVLHLCDHQRLTMDL